MKRRASLFALGCMATLLASAAVKPSRRASETFLPIELESQVPKQFGDWRVDASMIPLLPNQAVQAKLDSIYTQTLARTYVNPRGQQVMLSIAYGADQGSDATQAHRPEFCYTSQGFSIARIGQVPLFFGGHELRAERLIGRLGSRFEPITYWMTLNDKAVLPGLTRKLAQIRTGLGGLIPDGMLVRASTVGLDQMASFKVQEEFLSQLYVGLPESARARYFGS